MDFDARRRHEEAKQAHKDEDRLNERIQVVGIEFARHGSFCIMAARSTNNSFMLRQQFQPSQLYASDGGKMVNTVTTP
jgi:hypothetical protein